MREKEPALPEAGTRENTAGLLSEVTCTFWPHQPTVRFGKWTHRLSLAKQPGRPAGLKRAVPCGAIAVQDEIGELQRARAQDSQATREAARRRGEVTVASRAARQGSPGPVFSNSQSYKEDARKLLPAQGRFLEFSSASVDFRGSRPGEA